MKKKYLYTLLPIIGLLFCIYFISIATSDIVFTDYIRLVDSYLPDIFNPAKFFVPDVLTRIPLNYIGRIINVVFFNYSTTFDMILGVIGLAASAWLIGSYCKEKKVGMGWFSIIMVVMFSLNKWEMLTNGTGWVHFVAFACFFYHYRVADRVMMGRNEKEYDHILLMVLPFVIILGVAGPYCAIYAVTLLIFYGAFIFMDYCDTREINKECIRYFICTLIPLILYIMSNHMAVDDLPAGAVSGSIFTAFFRDPLFFVKFFVKSFGSMIFGGEVMAEIAPQGIVMFGIGAIVILFYLIALYLYVKLKIYKETLFPLILIISGGLNHLLIMASRWIFMKELYGLSSRYALQFQVGIIGILLTFALMKWDKRHVRMVKSWYQIVGVIFCILLVIGNSYTTYRELQKAPYRKEYSERLIAIAKNYKNVTDDELKEFQYEYTNVTRKALRTLEENNLNIYSK